MAVSEFTEFLKTDIEKQRRWITQARIPIE
jgi:hypothetical protein